MPGVLQRSSLHKTTASSGRNRYCISAGPAVEFLLLYHTFLMFSPKKVANGQEKLLLVVNSVNCKLYKLRISGSENRCISSFSCNRALLNRADHVAIMRMFAYRLGLMITITAVISKGRGHFFAVGKRAAVNTLRSLQGTAW